MARSTLKLLLEKHEARILAAWRKELAAAISTSRGRIGDDDLAKQTQEFLQLLVEASQSGSSGDIGGGAWQALRSFLEGVSASRAMQGFTSAETASFIFSIKPALFEILREAHTKDAAALADQTTEVSQLLDKLGLHTVDTFQKAREAVILRQQEEMLELSTPVVKLWDGVLALPVIGTLDSARTQVVMESLLQRIVDTGSELAILDITGVPTVDTLVAQHLIRTVTAIRLMGADCIISGVRPQIAQTIVHLGIELQGITTRATLADALSLALKRLGVTFTRAQKA
jgi:rsbT co-antagonist protein RsbR